MSNIAIIGSGMAGFGAANRLHSEGLNSVMFEKNHYHGGNAASFKHDLGYLFDAGPHISFTKDKRIQDLFARSIDQKYEILQAEVNNYWKGYRIKHPAQCNLHGLPDDLVVEILVDFVAVHNKQNREVANYEDWLIASFGEKFAETFPMKYGLKFHTTTADNMSTEWIGPRMYQPSLEEVFKGALSQKTPSVHYVDHFRYPTDNGFVSYLNAFLKKTETRLNHKLVRLDPNRKELHFDNGTIYPYDHIISSVPLPELVPMISGVPKDVLKASDALACTTCVLVNVGLDRVDISETHWQYFYDTEVFFTRLSFPHMLSTNNTPSSAGSIQAEVYYSNKYRPLDRSPEDCIQPVIDDLKRCGIVHNEDKIMFTNAMLMPYANVIFDLERKSALNTVHGYLDDIGVRYCGRYGEWGYLWTDESFKSGEKAAESIISNL